MTKCEKKIAIGKNSKGNLCVKGRGRLCDEDWRKIFKFDSSKLPSLRFCVNSETDENHGNVSNINNDDDNDIIMNEIDNNININNNSNNQCDVNDNKNNRNDFDSKNTNVKKNCCAIGLNFLRKKYNIICAFTAEKISAQITNSMQPSTSLQIYINNNKVEELLFRITTAEMIQKTTLSSENMFQKYPYLRMSCGRQVVLSSEKLQNIFIRIRHEKNDDAFLSTGYYDVENSEEKLKLLLQVTRQNIGQTVFEFIIFNEMPFNKNDVIDLKYFDGETAEPLQRVKNNNNHDNDDNKNDVNDDNNHGNDLDINNNMKDEISHIIELKLFSSDDSCDKFGNEIIVLWDKYDQNKKTTEFKKILKFFLEYGWYCRIDVVTLIDRLIGCTNSRRFAVLATFYYYQYEHTGECNKDIVFQIVVKWIQHIFQNPLFTTDFCSLKTSKNENILHLISQSDLSYTKAIYDEMMKHWQKFVQLLSEKNNVDLNPLFTSKGADSIYYVLTWLLKLYEAIHDEKYRSQYNTEIRNVTKIFASTCGYGNLLHFLANHKEIAYGKNHSIKDLYLKISEVIAKHNPVIFNQLLQSRSLHHK